MLFQNGRSQWEKKSRDKKLPLAKVQAKLKTIFTFRK